MKLCLSKKGIYNLEPSFEGKLLVISDQYRNVIGSFKYEDRVGVRYYRHIGLREDYTRTFKILQMDHALGLYVFECAYFCGGNLQVIYVEFLNKAYVVKDALVLYKMLRSLQIKEVMVLTRSTRWETEEDHWEFKKTPKRYKAFLNGVEMGTKTLENWQRYIFTRYNPIDKL